MGQEGHAVFRLDLRGARGQAIRLAIVAQRGIRFGVKGGLYGRKHLAGGFGVGGGGPLDLDGVHRLLRQPGVGGDHRQPVAQVHHLLDAGHPPGLEGVIAIHAATGG